MVIGQSRASTTTLETQGPLNSYYLNGRAGTNLIGQQQQQRATTTLEKQNATNISIDIESISLNASSQIGTSQKPPEHSGAGGAKKSKKAA